MSVTLTQIHTDVLLRPSFKDRDDSTKTKAVITLCVQLALRKYWESYRNHPLNLRTNAPSGLTLPAGTAWGANGKLYVLDSATSPVLTTDLDSLLKLWIVDGSTSLTYSSSTYSDGATPGSGIPDASDETLSLTNVFHELVGQDDSRKLVIYAGNTIAGATPKVAYNYVVDLTLPTTGTDKVQIPDEHYLSVYMPLVDEQMRYYFGTDK